MYQVAQNVHGPRFTPPLKIKFYFIFLRLIFSHKNISGLAQPELLPEVQVLRWFHQQPNPRAPQATWPREEEDLPTMMISDWNPLNLELRPGYWGLSKNIHSEKKVFTFTDNRGRENWFRGYANDTNLASNPPPPAQNYSWTKKLVILIKRSSLRRK